MADIGIISQTTTSSHILNHYEFKGILEHLEGIEKDIHTVNNSRKDSLKYSDASIRLTSKHYETLKLYELETHVGLQECLDYSNRKGLLYTIHKLEQEYDCKNSIDKILASNIALCMFRIQELTKKYNDLINNKFVDSRNNPIYNKDELALSRIISTELDRVHKQLNNSILTLKSLKTTTPKITVNVDKASLNL
jgi:hypothetical protein